MDQATWTLYVDGFSTNNSIGGGVILVTPKGTKFEYTIRFEFKVTNNEAVYEALLAGLRLTHALGAKRERVSSDS